MFDKGSKLKLLRNTETQLRSCSRPGHDNVSFSSMHDIDLIKYRFVSKSTVPFFFIPCWLIFPVLLGTICHNEI